jgi:hypothetical protein
MKKNKKQKAKDLKIIFWLMALIALIGIYNTHSLLDPVTASAPYGKIYQSFPIAEDKATSTMAVKDRIILEAQKANFKWTDYLLRLANCESGLNEFATNDKNNKPEWSKDRGVFQINDYWQKQVPDSVAYNVEEATRWTMDKINKGGQRIWVCDKLVRNNPAKYAVK